MWDESAAGQSPAADSERGDNPPSLHWLAVHRHKVVATVNAVLMRPLPPGTLVMEPTRRYDEPVVAGVSARVSWYRSKRSPAGPHAGSSRFQQVHGIAPRSV